ncbi:MAG: 3-deoxy-manno-octulosonate cytidylyltransferase [Deltaproteobacteria bacterium]|nr:3-deoxy-manno-octulosonate cytidylyltransferase [Deltaproteobacteria bacterium]
MARASSTLAILPARLGSTRLPRKMLADIGGQPLVVRTLERVRSVVERVVVATDAPEIAEVVTAAGGEAVLTGAAANGTERCWLAWRMIGAAHERPVIVNVQADEPLLDPLALRGVIDVASGLDNEDGIDIVTAAHPLRDPGNPARVKVVTGEDDRALYFSRAPIPHGGPHFGHVGIYAFREPAALFRAATMSTHPLELAERLEQLRWLARGMGIRVVFASEGEGGVDTPEDLERVRAHFAAAAAGGG